MTHAPRPSDAPHTSRRRALQTIGGIVAFGLAGGCRRANGETRPHPERVTEAAAVRLAAGAAPWISVAPRSLREILADAPDPSDRFAYNDAQWRNTLSAERYRVLRGHGTEWAFRGNLWNTTGDGTYLCAGCGNPLFGSADKFDSGTGWPSFTRPVQDGRVGESRDESLGMVRVEVHCARCGGHLGHVFPDGPPPTGLRYCINSASLVFVPARGTDDLSDG
jgi:peptide-methionine (R)-S-oxide reductase